MNLGVESFQKLQKIKDQLNSEKFIENSDENCLKWMTKSESGQNEMQFMKYNHNRICKHCCV